MTRPLAPHSQDILEEALSLTNGDRAQDYGDMQASFERIAATSEGEESGEEESTYDLALPEAGRKPTPTP